MHIFVLGMHRSGTSSITRLINMMGAYVGNEQELIGANEENPKGFWERHDVIEVNDAILAHFDCAWHQLANWPEDQLPKLPDALDAQLQAVMARLADQPVVCIKDPRLCHTLPYWIAKAKNPFVVMIHRHPAEIAMSLRKRNHLPAQVGMAMWEASALKMLEYRHRHQAHELHYHQLLQDPQGVSHKLYQALSAFAEQNKIEATLALPEAEAIHSFIDPALNRSHSNTTDIKPSIFQRMLLDSIQHHTTPYLPLDLSRDAKLLMQASEDIMALGREYERLGDEAQRHRHTVSEQEARINELSQECTELKNSNGQLQAEREEMKQDNEALRAENTELYGKLGELEYELEAIKSSKVWKMRNKLTGSD